MPLKSHEQVKNDYTEEELKANAESLEVAVTIPVNVEVEMDHRVLDLSEMEKLLRTAKTIILQDCGCRTERGNCDSPKDVCITLDQVPDYLVNNARYKPRVVDLSDALAALRMSHEAGLVHMAYTMKGDDRPTVICSCCPCCCHTLGGLLRHGIATKVLTSRFVASDDKDSCIDCGKCVDRCVFGARGIVGKELMYDDTKCFGCGLCVSTCTTGAIVLRERYG